MAKPFEDDLTAAADGDSLAADRLLPKVYDQLHGMAQRVFGAGAANTLQPTALVHEAFLRMAPSEGSPQAKFSSRAHFLAVAAKAMRQILVSHMRYRNREKRGGRQERVTLSGLSDARARDELELIDFYDSLEELRTYDEQLSEIVEQRVLAGMSFEEIAAVSGVSERTIERRWRGARAWLALRLNQPADPDSPQST